MAMTVDEAHRRTGLALRAIRDEVVAMFASGATNDEIMACVDHNVALTQRCLSELVEAATLDAPVRKVG